MQGSASEARSTTRPATGKLGIITPGLGAVATTFMAGVESIRRGYSPLENSVNSKMRISSQTDQLAPYR